MTSKDKLIDLVTIILPDANGSGTPSLAMYDRVPNGSPDPGAGWAPDYDRLQKTGARQMCQLQYECGLLPDPPCYENGQVMFRLFPVPRKRGMMVALRAWRTETMFERRHIWGLV